MLLPRLALTRPQRALRSPRQPGRMRSSASCSTALIAPKQAWKTGSLRVVSLVKRACGALAMYMGKSTARMVNRSQKRRPAESAASTPP